MNFYCLTQTIWLTRQRTRDLLLNRIRSGSDLMHDTDLGGGGSSTILTEDFSGVRDPSNQVLGQNF